MKFALPPLSVRTYGIAFLLLGLLLASTLVWLSLQRVAQLQGESLARSERLARAELAFTLKQVGEETRQLAERFTEWDELRQQFVDDTYYGYWRTRRAATAHFVPAYFDHIQLYRPDGTPLAEHPGSSLPRRIGNDHQGVHLRQRNGHYHLNYLSPIGDSKNPGGIVGYMAMELDFHQALSSLQKFRYVDINSLRLGALPEGSLEIDQLLPFLRYELRPNPEVDRFRELIIRTLEELGALAAVLGSALMYLLIRLGSSPLRLLSQQIDSLREGEAGRFRRPPATTFRVKEFEKVRHSLNDYHARLEEQRRALKDREARMRSLLENVPDSIVIVNGAGAIELCNPAAERLFGYSTDEAVGMAFEELFDPASRDRCREHIAGCCGGIHETGGSPVELLGQHREGGSFHVDLTLNRLDHEEERLFIAVARDVSDRKRAEERLRYMANYDVLTGLPNRTLFRDRLEQAKIHADRQGTCAALIFMDLDQFKRINDTLGHHVGDELLRQTAARLRGVLRQGDSVARLGGDEFTILVEDIDRPESGGKVAGKVLQAFAAPFRLEGQEIVVSPSMGITSYPTDDTDTDNLLKNADAAMYRAKERGGNTYQFFTADMNTRLNHRLALEGQLRRALEREEFRLFYQPRLDLESGAVVGAEALLRWQHPERGLVSPGEFIPVLEETGLIHEAGEWVFKEACRQLREWRGRGIDQLRVAVNVSARQFRQETLVESIVREIDAADIGPGSLEVEITEGLLIDNVQEAERTLARLSGLGLHISIDDFGTGYSSLMYLKRFPIHTLKIDQSFVRDISTDPDDAAIVELIISMAHTLGMRTTAEGVETEEQLAFLQARGCGEMQGFLLSRPAPPEDFEQWLLSRKTDLSEAAG